MRRRLKIFRVDELTPPDGWESSIDDAVVTQIAESIKREGLREPLVVIRTGHIVHGVHRWAAAREAGVEEIECVVEVQSKTPEDHLAKVITENLDRRHLSAGERRKMLAERVRLRIGAVAETPSNSGEIVEEGLLVHSGPKRSRGRPATAESEAIREVAAETGRSEQAVKHAVRREKAKLRKANTADAARVDERGNEIPPQLIERWESLREDCDRIVNLCRQISMSANRIKTLPGQDQLVQRLSESSKATSRIARLAKPYAVCPWCKGACGGCESCRDLGLQPKFQLDNVPKELLK